MAGKRLAHRKGKTRLFLASLFLSEFERLGQLEQKRGQKLNQGDLVEKQLNQETCLCCFITLLRKCWSQPVNANQQATRRPVERLDA